MSTYSARYGILDDEGQVVRWVADQPTHSAYIVQRTAVAKRATAYEIASKLVGEAPF